MALMMIVAVVLVVIGLCVRSGRFTVPARPAETRWWRPTVDTDYDKQPYD